MSGNQEVPQAASWELPGVPDHFQRLWTPHRLVYIQNHLHPEEHNCPFCAATDLRDSAGNLDDAAGLIVHRGEHAYALLNLFPYNTGHLLVCPYRHIATYDEATAEEVAEIGAITQKAMRVLTKVSGAQGFNIGMNQGQVAGAGIEEHLHQHIVPRWRNDSNFFPIIAQTKAIPRLLEEVRQDVAVTWLELD